MVAQRARKTSRFTVIIPPDRPDVREELEQQLSGEGVRVILERRRRERRPPSRAGAAEGLDVPGARRASMAGLMYIVSQGASELYALVKRHFADEPGIQVLYDRRCGERRGDPASSPPDSAERRLVERRQNDTAADLRAVGWALVRIEATA